MDVSMDIGPRILLWNYSFEEMAELDRLFESIDAPCVQVIDPEQGNLAVEDILFTGSRSDREYSSDEKVMLFFNVPARMIHALMREAKKWNLPKPIYAVITEQSIHWTFADLVDHLVKERDFIRKRAAEERMKHTFPHDS